MGKPTKASAGPITAAKDIPFIIQGMAAMSLRVNLVSVEKRNASRVKTLPTKTVCPECWADGEIVKPKQSYVCESGHAHPDAELFRAIESDDKSLTVIGEKKYTTGLNVPYEEGEIPQGLRFEVVPWGPLIAATVPTGGMWAVTLTEKASSVEASTLPIIAAAVDEDGGVRKTKTAEAYAVVGRWYTRGSDKMLMLKSWQGQLVVVDLQYPSILRDLTVTEQPTPDKKNVAIVKETFSKIATDFDVSEWVHPNEGSGERVIAKHKESGGDSSKAAAEKAMSKMEADLKSVLSSTKE